MVMTTPMIIMSFAIAILVAGFAGYLFWAQRKFGELEAANLSKKETLQLKLGAYERLTLLVERCKIDNLINRVYRPEWSATEMRMALISTIKDEYGHNVTQQLYVQPEVWDAVTRMKDQNMFIINQVANMMPPDSSAGEMNRRLLELLSQNDDATLNNVVLNAIQFEVKKLMAN